MKPLVLKEISEAIGVHESTVSRATTRKYMLTPRGLFELKYFFSSHVQNRPGRHHQCNSRQGTAAGVAGEGTDRQPPERSGPVRAVTPDRNNSGQEDRGQVPRVTGNRVVERTQAALPALPFLNDCMNESSMTRQLFIGIRLGIWICNPSRSHKTYEHGPKGRKRQIHPPH